MMAMITGGGRTGSTEELRLRLAYTMLLPVDSGTGAQMSPVLSHHDKDSSGLPPGGRHTSLYLVGAAQGLQSIVYFRLLASDRRRPGACIQLQVACFLPQSSLVFVFYVNTVI